MAITKSSFSTFKDCAISSTVGSLPNFFVKASPCDFALIASCLRDLDTFTIPSSLKYLLISPRIMGTAYVENFTLNVGSNLYIAFISPIEPN